MAEDFRAKVTAELDTTEAEGKLQTFLNKKNKLKIDVELNQDSAKKMTSSIETDKAGYHCFIKTAGRIF